MMALPPEEIIRRNSFPLSPVPAEETAGIRQAAIASKPPRFRCALFDLYGTLFISEAGDISTSMKNGSASFFSQALSLCGYNPEKAGIDPERFRSLFYSNMDARHEKLKKEGIGTPEVEIRDIWEKTLSMSGITAEKSRTELLAVTYESLANRTWPMPGLEKLLKALSKSPLILGIISNAQFYSEFLFKAHLDKSVFKLGFNESLCYYSYRYNTAKPGSAMFELAAENLLKNMGIKPGDVLYTGNDMLNDIKPAHETGMKTCLFAGDGRSLRLRKGDERVSGIVPDYVITDLSDLEKVLIN